MPKILQMPVKAVQSREDDDHIVRYPRMQCGALFADFMRDKRVYPEVYHCVIQREGEREILFWTQHPSLEDAEGAARAELALMTGSSSKGKIG